MHFLHLRTFHTVKPSKWSSRTIPCGSTLLKDLFQPTHRTAPHYHYFSNFGFTMDDAKRLGRTTNSLHLVPKVITAQILRSLDGFNFNQPVQTRSHCVLSNHRCHGQCKVEFFESKARVFTSRVHQGLDRF